MRIVNFANILIRRIGLDGGVVGCVFDGVTPFGPFRGRQRQRVVQHGGQHVDKRYFGNSGAKQVGCQIHRGTDQQPAGATAVNGDIAGLRPAAFDKGAGGGGKIFKAVCFFGPAPLHEPVMSARLAAAYMRDGIDEAARNEAQTGYRKTGRNGDAISAIPIKQNRGRAVQRRVAVINNRDRHFCTVMAGCCDAAGHIFGGVVAAGHILAFAQITHACAHVVISGLHRRGHGGVSKA